MKSRCIYKKCKFNCQSSRDHKVIYAKLKNTNKHKLHEKAPSSKVNWEKYKELFPA